MSRAWYVEPEPEAHRYTIKVVGGEAFEADLIPVIAVDPWQTSGATPERGGGGPKMGLQKTAAVGLSDSGRVRGFR